MCWHESSLRKGSDNMKSHSQSAGLAPLRGFSLVELLVVVALLSVLLVFGTTLFRNMGQAEGRTGGRDMVLAALSSAQIEAISSGKPVAFAMMPYQQGRPEQQGRAFATFQLRRDAVTGDYSVEEQTSRWRQLPPRVIFSEGVVMNEGSLNPFPEDEIIEVDVRTLDGTRMSVAAAAIVFGADGGVEWPSSSGDLEVQLDEGEVRDGNLVYARSQLADWSKREVIVIGRQTGRARYVDTQ